MRALYRWLVEFDLGNDESRKLTTAAFDVDGALWAARIQLDEEGAAGMPVVGVVRGKMLRKGWEDG